MKCLIVIFSVSVLWSGAVSEQCYTPLGRLSRCISLHSCPGLLHLFRQKPIELKGFYEESICGNFENIPRVCCGPTPDQNSTTIDYVREEKSLQYTGPAYPTSPKDSVPYTRKCGVMIQSRILGGENTTLSEFPWMALLGYQKSNEPLKYVCGGALINQRYVMSAAHCVVGEITEKYGFLTTVRLGEYDTDEKQDCLRGKCADPMWEVAVMSAHPHPRYSDRYANKRDDIALIRLAKRVKLTPYIQPICLVDNSQRIDAGMDMVVAGWGQTFTGPKSRYKQKLTLPVFNKSECVEIYRDLGLEITDRQLCAGGVFSKDTCIGDSGGPLMRKTLADQWEAVAVVSFGEGCGRDGVPGIYTAVQSHLAWIHQTLKSTNV